jgi:hypothetical protein
MRMGIPEMTKILEVFAGQGCLQPLTQPCPSVAKLIIALKTMT